MDARKQLDQARDLAGREPAPQPRLVLEHGLFRIRQDCDSVRLLAEGAPTLILALICLASFADSPIDAGWLDASQKRWLQAELHSEEERQAPSPATLQVMADPRVLLSAVAWFCMMTGSYCLICWLPQVVKQLSGFAPVAVGVISALPWVGLGFGMIVNSIHSDRSGERFWHVGLPLVIGGLCIGASLFAGNLELALVLLILGAAGLGAGQAVFWTIPQASLSRQATFIGVVVINTAGNIGGIVGPWLIGVVRERTGSYHLPVLALAAVTIIGVLVIVPIARLASRSRTLHQA